MNTDILAIHTNTMRTRGSAFDSTSDGEDTTINNTESNIGNNDNSLKNSNRNRNRVPEALLLRQEKDWYLNQNRAIPRTAIHHPTLEEFSSTPFEDYVRYTVMGVGCECCRKTPTFKNQCPEATFCKFQMKDGMAKIVPPVGWWNYEGIGKDLTGRGPAWAAGTIIGDLNLETPIKQHASGMAGVYEFTMMVVPDMKLSEFRKKADDYRNRQLGSALPEFDEEKLDTLALKFWKRLGPIMEAPLYGADLEGSLFNGANACGWNVEQLQSCIKLLCSDAPLAEHGFRLPGVTTAYLYAGMWGSTFAAHTEDLNLPSINYIHAGAPKYWYSISPEDSKRFECLASSHFAAVSKTCPEFLRHKRNLLSPSVLKKAGIKYKTQIQYPGEFMITFPGAYHFGFNTGFNMAESTNFAIPEWIHIGRKAGVCLCQPHSVRLDINRFQVLLNEYQEDNKTSSKTYTEWAEEKANKIKEAMETKQRISSCNDDKSSNTNTVNIKSRKPFIVPIALTTIISKKRRLTTKPPIQEYRIALKTSFKTFTVNTQVLCQLPDTEDATLKFFSGKIISVYENYIRIHFFGMSSKEDLWVERTCNYLWLNVGVPDQKDIDIQMKEKIKKRKVVTVN